jgi:hypothetical protein
MLIDSIRKDSTLNKYFQDSCSENGVSVNIDTSISRDDILIIKVDTYYHSETKKHDKCPDCLVIQKCSDNNYILHIIELRNIKNSGGFEVKEILEKFITCLEDFMSIRFGNYFHNSTNNYLKINLLFVSDPYHFKKHPEKQKFMRGHKLDALMSQNIPKYFGKHLYIAPKIPDPVILNCRDLF